VSDSAVCVVCGLARRPDEATDYKPASLVWVPTMSEPIHVECVETLWRDWPSRPR